MKCVIEKIIAGNNVEDILNETLDRVFTYKYFKEESLERYAKENGWTLIDDSNRKDMFMDMIRQMDMSYSYKPVLIKAILFYADNKGRIKLDDIVSYFRAFFENRRNQNLVVEQAKSVYLNKQITDKEILKNILIYPYKRFEDMGILKHTKTLGIIHVDESVWKKLTDDEKTEIEKICDGKLEAYYEKSK